MNIRQSKQTGTVFIEYVLVLTILAIFFMTQMDLIEDAMDTLVDAIVAEINALEVVVEAAGAIEIGAPAAGGVPGAGA